LPPALRPTTSSIDAVVALVKRALPGAVICLDVGGVKDGKPHNCATITVGDHDLGDAWGLPTAPLALVYTPLEALLAQEHPHA